MDMSDEDVIKWYTEAKAIHLQQIPEDLYPENDPESDEYEGIDYVDEED